MLAKYDYVITYFAKGLEETALHERKDGSSYIPIFAFRRLLVQLKDFISLFYLGLKLSLKIRKSVNFNIIKTWSYKSHVPFLNK